MKIKVAYLDYSSIFAGAERVLHTIVENLDRTQFEPYLIFPYPMEHHKGYSDLDCETHCLARKKSWWMGSDYWKHPLLGTDFIKRTIYGINIAIFLIKHKIKILHVNLLYHDVLMWLLPSKLLGINVLGHCRSQAPHRMPTKIAQKCCRLIACVSNYSRTQLLLTGNHAESRVVYDSIEVKAFMSKLTKSEAKANLGYDENIKLMVSVGQISWHKGHDNAIRAFAKIADKYPQLRLYIAGGGPNDILNAYKSLANELGVYDKVRFSECQVSNISDIYRAADLTLSLTKVGEAFGLVPFESSCLGTPFLAPNMGAVKEFITHMENGLLVDTNNVDEIAEYMEWVFNHYEEAIGMNLKVIEIIKTQISPSIMVSNLESIYKELC